jgi:hypothetical protein
MLQARRGLLAWQRPPVRCRLRPPRQITGWNDFRRTLPVLRPE